MKTEELVDLIRIKTIRGRVPEDVTGIAMDSRKIEPGHIFVCISGSRADGHDFIGEAIANGAALIIAEKDFSASYPDTCFVIVKDSAKVMALFANHLYGHPSGKLAVFGVTGTNGKTTVTHLIHEILRLAGHSSALSGTLGFLLDDKVTPTPNTTSDIISNMEMLQSAVTNGCEAITFEISSQGLLNGRGWGIDLDIAVFTNLSHDHLDFHETMERYGYAKSLLFSQLGQDLQKKKFAVLNADDPWSAEYAQMTPFETISYGLSAGADFCATDILYSEEETSFDLHTPEGRFHAKTPFIGEFNVYNVLAAVSALYAHRLDPAAIVRLLPSVPPVEGRMEKLPAEGGPAVYIDYAHTPDAIEKAVASLLPFKKGRLIVLIGSGNFRDQLKRPLMAEKASLADYVIITVNNPGKEPPATIVSQFEEGMLHDRYATFENREEAVRHAIGMASPEDIILLTDKGHEKTLLIGERQIPYSDREAALEQLKKRRSDLSGCK